MTHLKIGQVIRTREGRILRVESQLASGAEGACFRAKNTKTGGEVVVKVMFEAGNRDVDLARFAYLRRLELDRRCSEILGPIDIVESDGLHGYVSRYAPGESLDVYIGRGDYFLLARIQVALTIAHAVACLHSSGVASMDLDPTNVQVEVDGPVVKTRLLDLSGFAAPGFPAAVCGKRLYMSREIAEWVALKDRNAIDPSVAVPPFAAVVEAIAADLFSLAVLIHEVLLQVHPAAAETEASDAIELDRLYRQGWRFDPTRSDAPAIGLPAMTLNEELRGLLRRAFAGKRSERPAANEWVGALRGALFSIWVCKDCEQPSVLERGKIACVHCSALFPAPVFLVEGRRYAVVDELIVGRAHFGGAAAVSERHLVFSRFGAEFRIRSIGRNGAARWDPVGRAWELLESGRAYPVTPGVRLLLADQEATLA